MNESTVQISQWGSRTQPEREVGTGRQGGGVTTLTVGDLRRYLEGIPDHKEILFLKRDPDLSFDPVVIYDNTTITMEEDDDWLILRGDLFSDEGE